MTEARPDADHRLRAILAAVLALPPARVAGFTQDTGLFGHLPEMDSMALAQLLGAIEEGYGITIADEEVNAEIFATYGALLAFVRAKHIG